jgi:hypothetical protein
MIWDLFIRSSWETSSFISEEAFEEMQAQQNGIEEGLKTRPSRSRRDLSHVLCLLQMPIILVRKLLTISFSDFVERIEI